MKKNSFKIILSLVSIVLFVTLSAAPAPFMDTMSEDRYSPSAQALGMGGSFANIWTDDPQGMWENPAATALFAFKNKIGIGTSNLEWLDHFGSGTIAGGFHLGEKFTLGLGMTTVNWAYVPDEFSMTLFYGGLGAALSYHSFINASIGVSAKNLYLYYPDTSMSRNTTADIGVIVEWPILASFNKGNMTLFEHDLHMDVTPGIHYTFKNLGPEVTNNYLFGFNVNVSLYDNTAQTELMHVKYARDMKRDEFANAIEIGFYDMVFMRFGDHSYGSTLFNASGYGINYSHLIMSVVHALGADKDRTSLVNRLSLEQHWGTWSYSGNDIGVKGTTFLVKWQSK